MKSKKARVFRGTLRRAKFDKELLDSYQSWFSMVTFYGVESKKNITSKANSF